MEGQKENVLNMYSNVIPYECTKKIIEQMEKNICRIIVGNIQGTGFFCKIPFPNKNNMLPVFITNSHVIDNNSLYKENTEIIVDIKEENEIKKINLNNRIKYINEEYDITIIEIKEKDNIKNYLELDDIIMNDILYDENKNKEYIYKTIYIIQYPESELSVSYGIIDNINEEQKYNFIHKCSTKGGSSGSPVLSINNKLIGIHKEGFNGQFNIAAFLNYPIKEFIKLNYYYRKKYNNDEILLKDFNEKYNLTIEDIKINELDLQDKNIGNQGLNYLVKLELKKLKILKLYWNNISDIKLLENAKFEKIEKLDLGYNRISNIHILEKVNFKYLKELYLNDNNISDINALAKAKFENIEKLNLGGNKISDIDVLEKVSFRKITCLFLYNNFISDITILENTNFNELETLYLYGNSITNIDVLEKVNFKYLQELYLNRNYITDIGVLRKVKFNGLKELKLNNNNISDIRILEELNFENLELLNLRGNKIDEMKYNKIILKLKSKIKDFKI